MTAASAATDTPMPQASSRSSSSSIVIPTATPTTVSETMTVAKAGARAPVARGLHEREGDDARPDQPVEVPVCDDGDDAVVEAVDGGFREPGDEPEEDAGRRPEQGGPNAGAAGEATRRDEGRRDAAGDGSPEDPLAVGRVVDASLRVGDEREQCEAGAHGARADDLAPADSLTSQAGPDREREDDARDEQRLDDHKPAHAQRSGLPRPAKPVDRHPEQPDRLAQKPQQEPGLERVALGLLHRPLLLEDRAKREENRRDERQDDGQRAHAAPSSRPGSDPGVCPLSASLVPSTLTPSLSAHRAASVTASSPSA